MVELLEDWDAELPLVRDFGGLFVIGASDSVMLMTGGSALGRSVVGDGVSGALSVIGGSST